MITTAKLTPGVPSPYVSLAYVLVSACDDDDVLLSLFSTALSCECKSMVVFASGSFFFFFTAFLGCAYLYVGGSSNDIFQFT
jgi:hypothetical protein